MVLLALLAALLGLAGPLASPASATVGLRPVLDCVWKDADGTWRSLWGYENTTGAPITVPPGEANRFWGAYEATGLPTTFQPGRHRGVVMVAFSGGKVRWTVQDATVEASTSSPACGNQSVSMVPTRPAAAVALVLLTALGGLAFELRRVRRRAT